jgi:hypothetical protein
MRFLNPAECVSWCEKHGYPAGHRAGRTVPIADKKPTGFDFAEFSIPADSGAKAAFAKFLISLIMPTPETLLWLDEWSVWPSSQHLPLFTRFRAAFGEHRPLIDAPGHLVSSSEIEDATSILVVALEFVWDCHLLSASGQEAVFVSHDEYGWYASRDASEVAAVREKILSRMNGGS